MKQVINLARVPSRPWRNGGGTTQELLAWPAAAGDEWLLRVSVAHVEQGGPFSPFPGVLRGFVVLQGAGVRLTLPIGERTLERGDEPLWFDGEAAPWCDLLEGPTLDLNFMVRRGVGLARMRRAEPGSGIDSPTAWRALFACDAGLLEIDGVTEPVHAGDLVWSDAVDASPWRAPAGHGAVGWWLTLEH